MNRLPLFAFSLVLVQSFAYSQLRQAHSGGSVATKRRLQLPVESNAELVLNIKADVEQLILAEPTLAPKFLRLVFHHCIGDCNGCVDMANVSCGERNQIVACIDCFDNEFSLN